MLLPPVNSSTACNDLRLQTPLIDRPVQLTCTRSDLPRYWKNSTLHRTDGKNTAPKVTECHNDRWQRTADSGKEHPSMPTCLPSSRPFEQQNIAHTPHSNSPSNGNVGITSSWIQTLSDPSRERERVKISSLAFIVLVRNEKEEATVMIQRTD